MTIEPDTTFEQFQDIVLAQRKATRGNSLKMAEMKAILLLEVERAQGADRKITRIWSAYVRDVFARKSSKQGTSASKQTVPVGESFKKEGGGIPTDTFKGTPPKLVEAQALFNQLMYQPDPQAFPILVGAVASHLLREAPVMQCIIAPPSGGKTEHIMAFSRIPDFQLISTMTENTFLSAYDPEGEGGPEPSLLKRYPNPILGIKDLNTILSRNYHQSSGIMGQFMELADGEMKKPAGNGVEVYWKGHASALIGVTPHIYNLYDMMSKLGPRFLFLHLVQAESRAQARRAQDTNLSAHSIQDRIMDLIAGWYYDLELYHPEVDDETKEWMTDLADLVSLARSMVDRSKDGDIQSVQEREEPGRISKQFQSQGKGIARGFRRPAVGPIERGLLLRNGLDSLTPARRHILLKLSQFPNIGAGQLAQDSPISRYLIDRALEDMLVLNILEGKGLSQSVFAYSIHPRLQAPLQKVLALTGTPNL